MTSTLVTYKAQDKHAAWDGKEVCATYEASRNV